jgi:hypothetical protein
MHFTIVTIMAMLSIVPSALSLNIQIFLPANQTAFKTTEQSILPVRFAIDQFSSSTCIQKSNRFHLTVRIEDERVAGLHSGPFKQIDSQAPNESSSLFDQSQLTRDLQQTTANERYESYFQLVASQVGYTKMHVRLQCVDSRTDRIIESVHSQTVDVLVTRPLQNRWSSLFTVAVVVLVSFNNINMGCALDLHAVKASCARPIGPLIGLGSQYIFMPLLAFAIGMLVFPDVPYLRFGLFVFGCSPGGSGSNMWTVLLNGNLNLSITMTLISTFTAMATMPAWLFTLGRFSFGQAQLHGVKIPYFNIISTLGMMSLCLAVGLLIQRFFPKIAKVIPRVYESSRERERERKREK